MRSSLCATMATAAVFFAGVLGLATADDRPPSDVSKPPVQQRRNLRWRLVFDTKDGEDYARQLDTLGAILAVPDKDSSWRVIRDLKKRPAKGEVEDLTKIHNIFWIDDKPESVKQLAKALQLD